MSLKAQLLELAELAGHAGTRPTDTLLPGVMFIRGEVPRHQLAAVYEPIIGFTVQGTKTISIGEETIHAPAPSYYVIPTETPATGLVHQGKNGAPYLSIGLRIKRDILISLLKDLPPHPGKEGFAACEATPEFVDAWVRMLRLLKNPAAIPGLAPAYEREILYHVLTGPQGWRLRQVALADGKAPGIHHAAQWIRAHFAEAIDVEPIARKWGMAVTTFHRQFKVATGLSPIQFQKQLRLLEARRLMAFEGMAAASAAFEVGYQSPSQFNREYTRFFGASPARDTAQLRAIEKAR